MRKFASGPGSKRVLRSRTRQIPCCAGGWRVYSRNMRLSANKNLEFAVNYINFIVGEIKRDVFNISSHFIITVSSSRSIILSSIHFIFPTQIRRSFSTNFKPLESSYKGTVYEAYRLTFCTNLEVGSSFNNDESPYRTLCGIGAANINFE